MSFRLSPLLPLLASLLLLCAAPALSQDCAAPPTLDASDPVYVAVLVWGQNKAQPTGDWPDFMQQSPWGPPMVTVPNAQNVGFVLYNSYYQGLRMWAEPMWKRATPNLPFAQGGGADIRLRYINLASEDWTQPMGWRKSIDQAVSENVVGDQLNPTGLLYNLTDDTRYAEFGATQPFTFIIIPPYFDDRLTIALANRVEDSRSKILIHSFGANIEPFVCADPALVAEYGAVGGLATPDCDVRQRLPGQRRFHTLFSMLSDPAQCALSAMDVYHTNGVRKVGIFVGGPRDTETYPFYAGRATKESAENINIEALLYQTVVTCSGGSAASCSHAWPDGKTSLDIAREVKEQNVDVVVMVGGVGTISAPLLAELVSKFHEVGYTPKNYYFSGGIENALAALYPRKDAFDFASLTVPWVPQLRGPNFRSFNQPDRNFELYPAVPGGADSPEVWQANYTALRNPVAIQPVVGMVGYASLNVVQKMIELSRTKHVPTLLTNAASMAVPSPYGLINFDPTGRWSTKTQVLQQRGRLEDTGGSGYALTVTYPFNIAKPLSYPMPTWEERVAADPMSYNEFNDGNKVYDNAVIAVNTLVLGVALVVLALIVLFRRTSVIRSSTPWFCMLNVLGVILMLLSNYLTLTTVNDAMCAGQVWLLTLGFSITFGSLFFKTFRIWRIFGRKKLRVTKLKDTELLLYLAAFVATDLIINAVWQGAYGMPARLGVPDRFRPAFNYNECEYSGEALTFLYLHLALKGTLLFFGILLGYAVRNTPSAFNEATFIALSIYNVSLTSAFVIPILASGLGGRVTVLSIRAYAIMFISAATLAILFIPKFIKIFSNQIHTLDNNQTHLDVGDKEVSSSPHASPLNTRAFGRPSDGSAGGSGGSSGAPHTVVVAKKPHGVQVHPTGTATPTMGATSSSGSVHGSAAAYVVKVDTPLEQSPTASGMHSLPGSAPHADEVETLQPLQPPEDNSSQ